MARRLIRAIGAGLGAAVALGVCLPVEAQTTGKNVGAMSTPKPSGAIGTFAWYANGAYLNPATGTSLTANAFLPGIAVNMWFNPWFSVGVWGVSGAFGGALGGIIGPLANADLDLKAKVGQTGTGLWDVALTGIAGATLRSLGPANGASPKLGLLYDQNFPSGFVLQARIDWAPWLQFAGTPTSLLDYKLGVGWQLFHGFGMDAGMRGQTAFEAGSTMSLNGPYLGFGWVF